MINEFTHAFIFRISDLQNLIPISNAKQILDAKDVEKLTLIKSTNRAAEFIFGRYICKKILSIYTKKTIENINFKYDSRNKPYIENHNICIKFNLSHSNDFLALVIADKEVGIDIEATNNSMLPDIKNIAHEQYLTNEAKLVADISNDGDSLAAFYRFWTCKESALKAIGVGLYYPMKSVDCETLLSDEGIHLANKDEAYTVRAWYHLYKTAMLHIAVAKCGNFGETRVYMNNNALTMLMQSHGPYQSFFKV